MKKVEPLFKVKSENKLFLSGFTNENSISGKENKTDLRSKTWIDGK